MSVPRARLLQLMKTQCDVFSTTFNPDGLRLGNKVLRQRLRGPALAAYYPRKDATIKDVRRMFGPDIYAWDQKELDRLESLDLLHARGKGAPKKKREAPSAADLKKKRR
ncbi:hypothetical protein Cpir12675_000069 [Ceratocystis pirilliformis]|uniref:Small ribosomal subunit protein mS33 n=1 Tax=Ceratocystis pirilliformis TaxID=259994 RepID=A0ABR3ZNY5_9PEZI